VDAEAAIEEYLRRVWGDDEVATEDAFTVVRKTLYPALRAHGDQDDLLLHIAIFHEVVSEEFHLALTFFDRMAVHDGFDRVYHRARCLAQINRRDEALACIDGSGHGQDAEMVALREEIRTGHWARIDDDED